MPETGKDAKTKATASSTKPSRRNVLKSIAAATAAGFTMKSVGPFIRDA